MGVGMSNTNEFCLEPEPGDSKYLGSSLTINDQYLVVGDKGANRVVIYQKDSQRKWQRNRFIYPPESSISAQIGNGFGQNLKLDRNGLIIESLVTRIKKRTNLDQFPFKGSVELIAYEKFFVQLNEDKEILSLDFPIQEKKDLFQFYDLYRGKPRLITLNKKNQNFSREYIATHENLILAGSPGQDHNGKGLLFDLELPNKSPIELKAINTYLGDTVAISERFAVVGNSSRNNKRSDINSPYFSTTLIISLENNLAFLLNSKGYVSLDKNILAIMQPQRRIRMQGSKLELYLLDKKKIPHLILKRFDVKRARVENGWLITIKNSNSKLLKERCLESLEQIINQ